MCFDHHWSGTSSPATLHVGSIWRRFFVSFYFHLTALDLNMRLQILGEKGACGLESQEELLFSVL